MSYVIRVLQVNPTGVLGKFRTATVIQSQGKKERKKRAAAQKKGIISIVGAACGCQRRAK